MFMTKFETLFNQLESQEEVEGTMVGALATEVALYAAEAGVKVFPLEDNPTFLKVLVKKDNDLFMLADTGAEGVMFKYEGTPIGVSIIDFSALGLN